MGRNHTPYVTSGWNTGTSTGTGIEGAVCSVFKVTKQSPWTTRRADVDGRHFSDDKTARAFLASRGYLVAYRNAAAATFRSLNRNRLNPLHHAAMRQIQRCSERSELYDVGQRLRAELQTMNADFAVTNRWIAGFYAAARRLRPDLFLATAG